MAYKLLSLTYRVLHGDPCSLILYPSLAKMHSLAFLLPLNSSNLLRCPVWTLILEVSLPEMIFSQFLTLIFLPTQIFAQMSPS